MKFAQKLSAVAGLAIAAAAYAQPASFTDLGDRSTTTQTFSQPVSLIAANDIQWFKIVLPGVTATNGYVDIWNSAAATLNITDSEIGLYNNTGALVASNDDSGGLLSQLSFGLTSPTRTHNGTAAGGNGALAAGTYWVAVGRFNVTFNATGWSVTSTYASTQRNTVLNFDINVPGTPTPPTGVGAYTPNNGLAGASTVATVTVTPGSFPASTGIAVTLDASLLGAGSIAMRDNGVGPDAVAGDNIFSATVNTSGSLSPGVISTPFAVSDAQSRSSNGSMNFTVNAPPPANDDCSTAQTASLGLNGFNNSAASNDGLTACVTSSRDVWFKYTAANTNNLIFATCSNAAFDTVLSVYDSCGGTVLGCNDDGCGTQSTVTITGVTANTTYYVRVAGFGGASAGGAGSLNITEVVPPTPPQWDEAVNGGGDAGDLPGTAQIPTGTNPFNNIVGTFTDSDVDLYKIEICDPGTFSATTVNPTTGTQDTQLFLFDVTGAGVQFNDDATGVGPSAFGNQFVTTAGTYYIAITRYNRDPINAAAALIWENAPFTGVRAPDGIANGGDIVVTGWTGTFTSASQAYRIDMTGTCFASNVCAADFNADTVVDFFDYLDFVAAFSSNDPVADFNADTVIDFFDYLDFVAAFSVGC